MGKIKVILIGFLLILFVGSAGGLGFLYWRYSRDLPSLEAIKNYEPRTITVLLDRNNQPFSEYSNEKRIPVELKQISQNVLDAFIAAEDNEFYEHRGVNPLTIIRAAIRNFQAGRTVQGGSTITQQVVKSVLLSPEKSYERKIRELILARRLEQELSKDEIITLYLNHIFLGSGAYGVEAASQTYFGKPASDLSIPEAAILAGLPRAPSRDNPHANPKNAKNRQLYVLRRLQETGVITPTMYNEYVKTPVKIIPARSSQTHVAPFFAEHVRRYLVGKYGEQRSYNEGFRVYTTLDLKWQKAAEEAINSGLKAVDKRIGLRKPQTHLKNAQAIFEFNTKQHIQISREHYNYRLLMADGSMEDPFTEDERTPLEVKKIYTAVVIGKDNIGNRLLVQVGKEKGVIKPEGYAWAHEANPTEVYRDAIIRRPFTQLQIGHVIHVRLEELGKVEEKTDTVFSLEQIPLVQGALLSYSLPDGGIVSMVGGYDYNVVRSEFNRATQAQRQSGSAFKPFIFLAALEEGLTPSTIVVDSPIIYQGSSEEERFAKTWKPQNYSGDFVGDISLRSALAASRNIPTIKLLQHIGVKKVVDLVRKLGVKAPLNEDLSLALGSSSLTLEELLTSWAVFANQGRRVHPYFIRKIENRAGEIIEEHKPVPQEQVISENSAFLITDMLKSVVDFGTAAGEMRDFGRPAAGKTGTTNDYMDALYLGYIPQVLAGVWVGFDSNIQIGPNEPGGRAALPIWRKYMDVVKEDLPIVDFVPPKSIIKVAVDTSTGDLPKRQGAQTRLEVFADGTAPGQIRIDPETQRQIVNRTLVITGNKNIDSSSEAQESIFQNQDRIDTDQLDREEF